MVESGMNAYACGYLIHRTDRQGQDAGGSSALY